MTLAADAGVSYAHSKAIRSQRPHLGRAPLHYNHGATVGSLAFHGNNSYRVVGMELTRDLRERQGLQARATRCRFNPDVLLFCMSSLGPLLLGMR